MALEALVLLPTHADTVGERYRAGDILVLALAGHPWSDLERKAVNTLRRGWIRQIIYLGDRWLLASSIPRRTN